MRKSSTGTWMPAWVPENTTWLAFLLIICSVVQSSTGGYDGSMLNGLNILPSYTNYFNLNAATTGLNTASVFIGGFFGPIFSGVIADRLGRRPAIFWGCLGMIIGIILQGAAQNIAMFVVARIILGFFSQIAGIAAGVYLSETFPSRYRAWGVGLLNDFYYVGALIAAGITLGTGQWQSTWAWRAPSLFQAIFSILCIVILPFIPESPRWLAHEGYFEYARTVVAQTNSNGDVTNPVSVTVYKEIVDTLAWEKKEGVTMSPLEIVKTPTARKRLLIGMSPGPFSCVAGNIIASYYLGSELDTAGITSYNDQLKANVVLNVWCLGCSLAGTHLVAKWGRKPTALLSEVLLVICLFIIGGLSKLYADNPDGASQSLIYGDVAVMFLFQGFYSIAWTPLLYLYPPEVMNYSIRANGLAFSSFMLNALACVLVFVMPIGLTNIGWKMYMVNGSWDIVIIILIAVYWVETKGKTLEEIDAIFEGEKHSSVPDVEQVRTGKATVDVNEIERELHDEKGIELITARGNGKNSRFHYDLSSFICDFEGSNDANNRRLELPCFKSADIVFMTPDNCLEYLRYRTLKAGKRILITTYGIRRSFWLLDPAIIDAEIFMYASTLDGIGKVGRCISVDEICLSQIWLDVLITGTGAINEKGVRFGKGHEYFDLEWAILSATMVSGPASTTVAVVHDCQVLKENLKPEIFDIACDLIITPTRTIHVEKAQKPDCGILWDKLQPGMLEDIRPLQELKMVEDAH